MKKITTTLIALMTASAILHAQEKKEQKARATKEASTAFRQKFPTAKNAKWEKEDADFEVTFKKDGNEMSALFAASGSWKETEIEMPVAQLPATAKTYMAQHYKGKKIKETARIEKTDGSINYEAEISGMDVLFYATGNFIEEVKH